MNIFSLVSVVRWSGWLGSQIGQAQHGGFDQGGQVDQDNQDGQDGQGGQFTRPGFISSAGISTFFCAAVGIACLLVCLEVVLVMTAGDEA